MPAQHREITDLALAEAVSPESLLNRNLSFDASNRGLRAKIGSWRFWREAAFSATPSGEVNKLRRPLRRTLAVLSDVVTIDRWRELCLQHCL
jgi:hypothetical protein